MLTGRLNRDGSPSACQAPKAVPPVIDSVSRHYDSYVFTNTTGVQTCFTVNIDAGACTGASYLFSAAYLGSFDPNDLSANYLADIGISPNPRGSYSFSVPAGARFVVVVHAIDPAAQCPAYAVTVSNCPCAISFSDVQPADYFYAPVQYLYCHGAISGYADNTFRPYNNTTRGQLAKIVALAEGWPLYTPLAPTFRDVPPTDPFYRFVETAYNRGIISGYSCGAGCLEFRPGNNATRGQICKIVYLAVSQP
jgi:hypothetical protein